VVHRVTALAVGTRDTAFVAERSRTGWLLTAGVIGPIFFVVVFLVEGWIRPNYDAQRMFISQLSLTGDGWQQIGNFLITGLLFVGAAIGWRRAMPDGPGCRSVPILLGLAGIGLMVAGVFVTDPSHGYPPGTPPGMSTETSWHGAIHALSSVFVLLGLPIAMMIVARRFSGQGSRWALYSMASAVLMLAALVGTYSFMDVLGLMQRVAVVIGFGWVAQVSWRFRAEAAAA
jgi:hypothetical membrane protein